MIITHGEIDINKMRRRVNTYISILIMTVLTVIISSCSEDENGLYGIDSINIKCIVADYQSNTFNITRTATETLPLSTNYDDSKIEKLDLLVYNGDKLIQHLTQNFSNTSNTAIWDVKNKIPKDYLLNSSYTHILIANYPESSTELDGLTLSALKSKQFTPNDYDPAKAFSNAIPMIQELPANETKPFDGTTLTFDALERVVAKIQVNSVNWINSYRHIKTLDFETENSFSDWTGDDKPANSYWNTRTDGSHFINFKNYDGSGPRTISFKEFPDDFKKSNNWKMEFIWGGYSGNYTGASSKFEIKGVLNNGQEKSICSILFYSYEDKASIQNSSGIEIGTIDIDKYQKDKTDVQCMVKIFHKIILIGTPDAITLSIENNEFIQDMKVSEFANIVSFYIECGRSWSQMAFDDIAMYTIDDNYLENQIEKYKLINYIKGYNIYNKDDDPDYANDKNKSNGFGVGNPIVENQIRISNNEENFIKFPDANYSAMQGTNSFAFYVYPNYWFDNSKDMSQMEPIKSEYQTCVLVKAKYVMDNGSLSNRYFYYKVPVNYRLPKYNDIGRNNDYFDADIDQMCEDLFPKLRDSDLKKLAISDADKNNIINKLYSKMLNAIYYDRAPNQSEIDKLSDLCKDIYDAAEKAYNDYEYDGNESTWNNTKTIKSNAKSAAKSADLKAELSTIITEKDKIDKPNYYRIKRNHHYSAYVSFDQQGGEVENEALYIASEPFMDVVIRPKF